MKQGKPAPFCMVVSCSLLILLSCENPFLKDFFNQRTVTYYTNGGNAVAPQKLVRDDKIQRPADPGRGGYAFDGWYEDNGTFKLLWNFDITPSSDLTLYAKWREIDDSGCNHQWGDWYTMLAPTCIAAGIETRYCIFDETHTQTREIPIDPNAHHWVGVDGEGVAPTCTTDGHGRIRCELCGEEMIADNIPALGHDKGEWHITLEPTCKETGIRELLCTRDEEVLAVEFIDALGHDWGDWEVTIPATFVMTGEETRTCRRCGETETRVIPRTAATPTADPAAGAVTSGTYISLSGETEGADIYYTLDGSDPTASSTKYAAPFAIDPPVTVKAIAVKDGMVNSGILTAAYTLAAAATPTADPAAGAVTSGTYISLSGATAGADIYYTLDGSDPTASSTKYAAPFAIDPPVTVKAIAVKDGMTNSGILTAAYTYTLGVAMAFVPGGTFLMGSPETETDRSTSEGPQHAVTLSGFYMGVYQVTQEEYQAVMGSNPSNFKTAVSGESGTPDKLPVEMVSWYDALVFCNKLSMAEGLSPAYSINGNTDPDVWGTIPTVSNATWDAAAIVNGADGYRLPTEAQWEYACRAGTTTAYNTGDTISDDIGWYSDNGMSQTHQVGLKSPNAWGLYEMHGNVSEWCWDWYDSSYYTSEEQTDPVGPASGTSRVVRGGSWFSWEGDARSASRINGLPYGYSYYFGFRLLRP